jgi:L-cystine transport system substrate-binding protein
MKRGFIMKKFFSYAKATALLLFFILTQVRTTAMAAQISIKPDKIKTVIVGTGIDFKPVCYQDENGNLAGLEYEIFKAIDERLEEYEFKFEILDFVNILLSLEAGRIDVAAHTYAKNQDRVDKFLFGEVMYAASDMRVIVSIDNNDIHSIDDLAGKKIYVGAGSNNAYVAEEYNKEHGNALNIYYGRLDSAAFVQSIVNGTYDAGFLKPMTLREYNNAFGEKLKSVGDPIHASGNYYIFNKNNPELQKIVDKTLLQMKEDGTLYTIVGKFLGEYAIPRDAKAPSK